MSVRGQRPAPSRTELRPFGTLPTRVRLVVAALCLGLVGFLVWLTIHLLAVDSLPIAILLIAMSYVGFGALAVAIVTVTRALFSLAAIPHLLGRGIRRLLSRR